jgi:SAM-dependent methyltransferase
MKESKQDNYYLVKEGNSFFHRNIKDDDIPELRTNKKVILDHINESKIEFQNVLEFGCNYGDLLFYFQNKNKLKNCIGVEPSSDAIEFGKKKYGKKIKLYNGTIAKNTINSNKKFENFFDLIIIDDVFGWVSRETILQSVANIDNLLKNDGHIFIRDFFPDKCIRNKNHHVKGGFVSNFKVPQSHASIFLSTGIYEIHWQKIFFDNIGMSTNYKTNNIFNYRWTDVILKKSYKNYFFESEKNEN